MEAVARVARGISSGIGETADSAGQTLLQLLAELSPAHPAYERLEELREAVQRIASVTRQLGAFTRPSAKGGRTDVNRAVERALPLLERLAGPVVAVAFDPHGEATLVRADDATIEQMLFHLVVNARDALPDGGTVRLAASRRNLPIAYEHRHGVLPAGEWVLLEVSDNGTGMSAEALDRLFEPFFTTKEPGLGTGLGMSTVYALMRQASGHVMVESDADAGTTVTLAWPLAAERDADRPVAPSTDDTAILLVDSDAWVRTIVTRMLRRAGYGVLGADGPKSALELMHGVAGRCVRLVLADATLSAGGHAELLGLMRREFPALPVVTMTAIVRPTAGHSDTRGDTGAAAVLAKPFTQGELLDAVRAHLR